MASDPARRFVFDTNTLVSGFLFPHSIPGQALDLALARFHVLLSIETAAELGEVLRREKFDRFLTQQRRNELLVETILESEFVPVSSHLSACRDVFDNKFLELAMDGGATAIITGDSDLLELHPFQGIAILTARDFLLQFSVQ